MLFKFLQKPVVLDCFTYDPFAYEHAKIDLARRTIPEWWKELPNSQSLTNMKACKGFTDYYNSSLYLPSWIRVNFSVKDRNERQMTWKCTSDLSVEVHNHNQFAGFVSYDYQLLKIISPWYVKCKEDVKFSVSDPIWNRQGVDNIITLPGILSFKYQYETNINIMIKYLDLPREVDIMAGDPLMIMTPLTERKIILNHHYIDEKEKAKFMFPERLFLQGSNEDRGKFNLLKFKKIFVDKNLEAAEKPKCPFGFTSKKEKS